MSVRFGAAAALATLLAGLTSGCTASGHDSAQAATHSHGWRAVRTPASGARVDVIRRSNGRLLLFGSVPGADGAAPAAWWATSGVDAWHRIPTTASTGYGAQAEFVMASVADGRIVAFGHAVGGAHSNPRPTLWSGTTSTLVEHEQPFTTFAGLDAISQNALATRPGTAVIVGAWGTPIRRAGASPWAQRYGAAAWVSRDGSRWTRYSDAPNLASRRGEQTNARDVTAGPAGFVSVGDVTRGTAPTAPLAWTSPDGRAWQREELPTRGAATAARAACDDTGCLVVGNTLSAHSALQCWQLSSDGAAHRGTAGPRGSLIMPTGLVLLPGGRALALAEIDGRARLFTVTRHCTGWRSIPTPASAPHAAIADVGDRLVLATTPASGHSRLWVRTLN